MTATFSPKLLIIWIQLLISVVFPLFLKPTIWINFTGSTLAPHLLARVKEYRLSYRLCILLNHSTTSLNNFVLKYKRHILFYYIILDTQLYLTLQDLTFDA